MSCKAWILEGSGCMPWPVKNCTIKGNLRLPDVTLCAIEYNTMGLGRLNSAQEVLIMLLRSMTKHVYIVMNGDNGR